MWGPLTVQQCCPVITTGLPPGPPITLPSHAAHKTCFHTAVYSHLMSQFTVMNPPFSSLMQAFIGILLRGREGAISQLTPVSGRLQIKSWSAKIIPPRTLSACCFPIICIFGFTPMQTGIDSLPCKTIWGIMGEACLQEVTV